MSYSLSAGWGAWSRGGLDDAPAAVHDETRTGDEGCFAGTEERYGRGDLLGRTEAARGRLGDAAFAFLGRNPVPGGGQDRSRQDGVDAHLWPVLDGELAAEGEQGALG